MPVEVEGMDELVRKLQNLGGTPDQLRDILVKAANPIWQAMGQKAPEDTTHLKQSVVIQDMSKGDDIKVGIGIFEPDTANYATYQEFGTGIYATGEGGSRAKRIPWLWEVTSQKWADIFGIEVGESVVWYGNHPTPFVRPAFDENVDKAKDLIKEGLKAEINRKTV
jgi:HK97 gp10 family phage protein